MEVVVDNILVSNDNVGAMELVDDSILVSNDNVDAKEEVSDNQVVAENLVGVHLVVSPTDEEYVDVIGILGNVDGLLKEDFVFEDYLVDVNVAGNVVGEEVHNYHVDDTVNSFIDETIVSPTVVAMESLENIVDNVDNGENVDNVENGVVRALKACVGVIQSESLGVNVIQYLGNNKWYQSLVRSFDQKKNKTQVQQNLHRWPNQVQRMKYLMTLSVLKLVEARLVEFKNQEIKFCEKIRGLEFSVESKNNRIERLTKELEELKKEKEGLDTKLTVMFPPLAQVYSPPKKDMSWTRLPEFADDTIIDYTRPSPIIESNPNDLQNNSSSISKIGESTSNILSKPEIKFVKATDSTTVVKTNKDDTVRKPSVKYAEMCRKTSKSSNDRGN
nr:hypothetical protein [Tanacetum cinerariifolium]